MEFFPIIVFSAMLMYVCRLAGFIVNISRPFPQSETFLHYLPISVLCALTASSLLHEPASIGVKGIAFIASGIVVWKMQRMGLAILIGLAIFWLLRYKLLFIPAMIFPQ